MVQILQSMEIKMIQRQGPGDKQSQIRSQNWATHLKRLGKVAESRQGRTKGKTRKTKQNKGFKMKRAADSGVVCMLKLAILVMTGEETFKSVARLAQKNQEKF